MSGAKSEKTRLLSSYLLSSSTCLALVAGRCLNCVFLVHSRWVDALLNFLLVWYYCTLTIRESILIVNGSRYFDYVCLWTDGLVLSFIHALKALGVFLTVDLSIHLLLTCLKNKILSLMTHCYIC